jgi:hypothetical protein
MRGIVAAAALLSLVLPAHAALVITEVLPNPASVSDSYSEWFELYNEGPGSVDMYGYRIADLDTEEFEVTEHVVVPPGGFAIFARSGDPDVNGGVNVDCVYYNVFSLSNAVDEIVIYDASDVLVDEVAYVSGTGCWPSVPNGASLYYGWCGDNNSGACWYAETEYTFGLGDHGTPGDAPRLPSATDFETWSSIKGLYRK